MSDYKYVKIEQKVFDTLVEKYKNIWEMLFSWCKRKFMICLEERRQLIIKKYEIWLVDFGSNVGHEQNKVRPAIVINNSFSFGLHMVTVIPLTSDKGQKINKRLCVKIICDGQKTKSVSLSLIHQIRSVDTKRLIYRVGTASKQEITEIQEKLHRFLN